MTLQQLYYIIEISKCQSITIAAQNLFLSQPSLSKAIKDLETEFNITILERTRRGVAFTIEGLEFLAYAQRILEQINSLEDYFSSDTKSSKRLTLSVSAQHYMFSIDALTRFVKSIEDSSKYTIIFNECRTSKVIENVLLHQSQIGILYLSRSTNKFMKRLFNQKGLDFTPLRQFNPYAYLRREHPLSQQDAITIDSLANFPYLKYYQSTDSQQFSEELLINGISDDRNLIVSDRSTMLRLIQHTDAYTIGCGCVLPDIVNDEVISIPLAEPIDYINVGWIKLKNIDTTPEMEEYIELLEDCLDDLLYPTQKI